MTQSDDFLSIQTPENIAFGYQVAGLGTRFIAVALDTLIMLLVMFVALLAAVFFANTADLVTVIGEGWVFGVYSVVTFLIFWGYFVVFEMMWAGQTPGKRYMGVRVIGRSGSPVGLAGSLIRNFVRLIDFIPAFYGVGVITMFANLKTRRLGDFAAGTLVVFDKNVTLTTLTQQTTVQHREMPKEALWYPVERLAEADVAVGEAWLARRTTLPTAPNLIRPILQRLHDSMGIEFESQLYYEEAINRLEAIVTAYRHR